MEEQKPIMFNHNERISAMNNGDLGIPEITDKDCKILRVHENSVDCVSANPKNEKEFATGSHDKTIIVWDAETAKPKKQITGNEQGIWNLNYFQDGARLISASPDGGMCKVWDIRTGKATTILKGAHTGNVYKAMLNGNDTMVASCGSDKKICVWDLRKAAKPVSVNQESESCIMTCDWTNDDTHILSGTMYGIVNSLNVQTNKMVMRKDTNEMSPDAESNIIFNLRSVKNHPRKGNVFTMGVENRLAYTVDYDHKAKFENWFLEIFQKYEGHHSAIRD
jgi:WD40 repeat protein